MRQSTLLFDRFEDECKYAYIEYSYVIKRRLILLYRKRRDS